MKTPKLNLKKLEPHPLGALFPPMGDEEYEGLKNGMKLNGFDPQHKIVLLEGQILEGNNRYTAAKTTKTDPQFIKFEDLKFPGSPLDYVIQENMSRRNLSPSQLAIVGAELVKKMEEAEKAEAANLQANGATKPTTKKSKGEKVAKAAKMTKVSKRSIAAARALQKKDPEASKRVKGGKESLHSATKGAASKQSAEEAKTEAFSKATDRIDKICGVGFSLQSAEHLQSKDILKLSGLEAGELKRIKPFIEAGWSLKNAIGYKSVDLSFKHTLGQLRDRAIAAGNKFLLELGEWRFTAERK